MCLTEQVIKADASPSLVLNFFFLGSHHFSCFSLSPFNPNTIPRLSIPITQDECLYDGRCTKKADNLFVDLLIESHVLGKWNNGHPGRAVFDYCHSVFIGELELLYTHEEFDERFDFLQKWYQVFSWMLGMPGLRHCVQSNILIAPVAIWDDVFESYAFSVAYQHSGDPRWADLRFMFEEVFSTNPRSEVVHDRNSTNEGLFALPAARTNVVSDNSYHNALQTLCSRNNAPTRHGGRTMPLLKDLSTRMPMAGSRTPLRIPRPPRKHKPDLASCMGSTSDPH
ncbi:glycogen synthase, partial [Striga asiatica]